MNQKNTHILGWSLLSALVLVFISCSDSSNQEGDDGTKVPVEIAVAQKQSIDRTLSYDGDVKAELEIQVFSKIPDRIEQVMANVGNYVKEGAVIARVRATAIEQAVRQAEAALVAARSREANVRLEVDRSQRLFNEKALSQQQLDAIRTQFEAVAAQREQAEAMVKTAKSQLNDAQITAPISGIVAARNFEQGDMASPAQPLFTIVQMSRVRVAFDVPESDIGLLKLGQQAEIRVKSYPDRLFKGRIAEVSPVLDRLTRMARVEAMLDNPGHVLKPGMFAHVEVRVGSISNIVVVPRYATIESSSLEQQTGKSSVAKNYYLFVVSGDRAYQRKLDVAYLDHEHVAVSGGIKSGEQYVTVGQASLRDSVRVEIRRQQDKPQ